MLVLVATPIGNLGDISPRAAETLAAADLICCEDTRHSRKLLSHLGIQKKPLLSLHEHNEDQRIAQVIDGLADGQTIAVISDAGTPVVSDPGQRLVAAVHAANYQVTAIPGPSAAVMALAVSGLPAERFSFEGFLPAKGAERRERLKLLVGAHQTTVLYESPHRLAKLLGELAADSEPTRKIVLARELTKLHEEIWSGALSEAVRHLASSSPRGEYTLVLEGIPATIEAVSDEMIRAALTTQHSLGQSGRRAIDEVTIQLGVPRKRVYAISLELAA